MTLFLYRAVSANGGQATGSLEADTHVEALARVRRLGLAPIEMRPARSSETGRPVEKSPGSRARKSTTKTIGELAVLLNAGLQLDRALALAIENVEHTATREAFIELLKLVKEGVPLARAMAGRPGLFPPMAQAMVEAGEADGKLGQALERLAETFQRTDELKALIATSTIYPIALGSIATGVILLMLLYVVPQFESVFLSTDGELPAASMAVMTASQILRNYAWHLLAAVVSAAAIARVILARPEIRRRVDRGVLRLPQLGTLIVYGETARFARIMGALIDGGVPVPDALVMAQRSMTNTHLAESLARVARGLKQGGGLTTLLASTGVFPKLVLGFLRTGEETGQLGLMLGRLADLLDQEVRQRLQRLIGILTPAITVVMGASVAAIIASIMTAILGFNELALT